MSEIQALKKVSVIVREKEGAASKSDGLAFTYIHGIAVEGLSTFENNLDGAKVGDKISLSVKAEKSVEFFGNVLGQVSPIINKEISPAQFDLEVEITKIVPAENREVVAALAGTSGGCGSGGDCGCGCGGH